MLGVVGGAVGGGPQCWFGFLFLVFAILELYWGSIGVILGLYGDNGQENGNDHNGLYWVSGLSLS